MRLSRFVSIGVSAALMAGLPGLATAAPYSNDAPGVPLPVPKDGEYAVAQSAQIRMTADAEPNGGRINLRWSVTQVTAQGKKTPESVNVPEEGVMLHSLDGFGYPQENAETGTADLPLKDEGAYAEARTVSLMPQDFQVPLRLTAKFTLNGKPISAEDLVGKDGVVTAKYTVTNLSREQLDVPITTLLGKPKSESVEAMTPFVVQAETFLPQRFTGLNTGNGMGGADGRGNMQISWIALPFAPLSPKGKASFGWAANVTDAVIPEIVVQALPLYLPNASLAGKLPSGSTPGRPSLNVTAPGVGPGAAEVVGGLGTFLTGLRGFANASNGKDPIDGLQRKINGMFNKIGVDLVKISNKLQPIPADIDRAIAKISSAEQKLTAINQRLTRINDLLDKNADKLQILVDNWPELSAALQELNTLIPEILVVLAGNLPVDCSVSDPAQPSKPGTISVGKINKRILIRDGGDYQGYVAKAKDLPKTGNQINDAYVFGGGLTKGGAIWRVAKGDTKPDWDQSMKTVPTSTPACKTAVSVADNVIANSPTAKKVSERLSAIYPVVQRLAAVKALQPQNAKELQFLLNELLTELPKLLGTLVPLTNDLQVVMASLSKDLTSLRNKIAKLDAELATIGASVGEKNVELPELDALVSKLVAQVLASPNGQLVTSGLVEVGGGLEYIKAQLVSFIAGAVLAARAGIAAAKQKGKAAKAKARSATAKVNHLKGQIGGTLEMAKASPLVYGGDAADAPTGTQLAGAYEFVLDASDQEGPATLPRVVVGLGLVLLAALLGRFVMARRRRENAPAESEPVVDEVEQGGEPEPVEQD